MKRVLRQLYLLNLYHVFVNPRQQLIETAAIILQQPNQKPVRFFSVYLQLVTVHAQEHIGRKECNAFITVNERGGMMRDSKSAAAISARSA